MRFQGSSEVHGTRRSPRVPIGIVVALCALSVAGGAYLALRIALRNTIPRLRRALDGDDPLLIVTPFPDTLTADAEAKFNAISVQWRNPADTPALVDALRKAAPQ